MENQTRYARIRRVTKETDINLELAIDGSGDYRGESGCGFFDHLLEAFCRHGLFDLKLSIVGDVQVDFHHSAEDVGIVLGQALKEALGDKSGIRRAGSCHMPMDEALAFVALDISGRGYLKDDVRYPQERTGSYETCLTTEFLRALATNAGITLHTSCQGDNSHHMTEAVFKALARALRAACEADPRGSGIPSSKGVL